MDTEEYKKRWYPRESKLSPIAQTAHKIRGMAANLKKAEIALTTLRESNVLCPTTLDTLHDSMLAKLREIRDVAIEACEPGDW